MKKFLAKLFNFKKSSLNWKQGQISENLEQVYESWYYTKFYGYVVNFD